MKKEAAIFNYVNLDALNECRLLKVKYVNTSYQVQNM